MAARFSTYNINPLPGSRSGLSTVPALYVTVAPLVPPVRVSPFVQAVVRPSTTELLVKNKFVVAASHSTTFAVAASVFVFVSYLLRLQ